MKLYKVQVNMSASFLYEIEADSLESAEEKALEKAKDEYYENGIDYPHFESEVISDSRI